MRGVLRHGQCSVGDVVLLPTAGSPPGAACRASQPRGLTGLCCSRHFPQNKSSGSRSEAPVGALPPPDPPPCPPAGSGTSLFPHRSFQRAPPHPVLSRLASSQWLQRAVVRASGRAARWPDASFVKSFKMEAALPRLPIVRHGYALPYFSPGSDSPF